MRIIVATVSAGAGHLQAAAALEETWKLEHPQDTVQTVDLLEWVPKIQKKVYASSYLSLVEHAPELWGMVFKKTDDPESVRKMSDWRRAVAQATNRKFVKHLKEFEPDIVFCTHYLALEVLGGLKEENDWRHPFTVSVVTDFEAHSLWMEDSADLYCVAYEQTKASLVARGVKADEIAVTGIPIGLKFSRPVDLPAFRKKQGLRDDTHVVLVLSGGFGMGPVEEILAELDKVKMPLQVIVIAGRNPELRQDLAIKDYVHPTHVFGFVTNMHEWMAAADLIISKPGGLTSSETLAMGKPMFILNPIPGQETANSDFLLERGAATKVNRPEDIPHRVERLFATKKLAQLAKAAKALGKPNAARDVCREVMERVSKRTRMPRTASTVKQ